LGYKISKHRHFVLGTVVFYLPWEIYFCFQTFKFGASASRWASTGRCKETVHARCCH